MKAICTPNQGSHSAPAEQSLRGEIRSVGRHSLIYMLGPALANLVGFVLIPIYTYHMDRGDYGVMALVDVVTSFAMMLLSFGVADGLARYYYAEQDPQERARLVSAALLGPALLSLPLVLLSILLADSLRASLGIAVNHTDYLRWSLFAAWFSMIVEVGYAYLRICYFAKTFMLLTGLQILGSVSLNLWFVVVKGWGIWGVLYSTLAVQGILAVALSGVVLARSGRLPSSRHVVQLLAFGSHLVPATAALQLSNYLAPLMLRWWLVGDPLWIMAQIGLYAMGQKLGVVVNRFVTVPFNAFWRPRRMELVVQDNDFVRRILARMCTYATLITTQVALAIALLAQPVLRNLVKAEYWEAYRVVPWIAASYVILSLEHHFVTGMHYAQRTSRAPWVGVASLLVQIMVSVVLIPRYGMEGAAAATLASVTVRSGLFAVISQRHYPLPYEYGRLAALGAAAAVLFGVGVMLPTHSLAAMFACRVGLSLAYLPLLVGVGFFIPSELSGVRAALEGWRR